MIQITNENNLVLMQRYPDKHFDLAVVDPPYFDGPNHLGYYGNGYYSSTNVTRPQYKEIGNWDIPTDEYFHSLFRVSKHQIIFGINYFPFHNFGPGRIVWDKCNGASSFSDCEIAYNSITSRVDLFRYMWNGMMQGKSMEEGYIQQGDKRKNEKRIHPTQKPVIIYKWLLSKYAKAGWKILDTHIGSGSIAVACIDLGYDLTGCEIEIDYFNAANKRINEHLAQGKLDFGGHE
jgi:site-specific DNA-methyltransferase (adenine-specific)